MTHCFSENFTYPCVAKLDLPPVPPLRKPGEKKVNPSPSSIASFDFDNMKDGGVVPITFDACAETRKHAAGPAKLSPTSAFKQSAPWRAQSPTDHNRMRSPNFILRKRYTTSFQEETQRTSATFSNI